MSYEKLIDQSTKAIKGKFSESDCRELLTLLNAACAEVDGELDRLHNRDTTREAIAIGKPDVLLANDRKMEELRAVITILLDRREGIAKAAEEAALREAPGLAKDAYRALPAAVERLRVARQQMQEAETEVHELVKQARAARRLTHKAGVKCPAMSEKDFDALAAQTWHAKKPGGTADGLRHAAADAKRDLCDVPPPEPKMVRIFTDEERRERGMPRWL